MTQEIRIGEDKVVTLEFGLIEDIINVDDLTIIDTSNLFGEAVTISAAANRIGLMKSDVDSNLANLKLDLRLFESDYRNKLRAEASKNNGSYTMQVAGEEVKVKLTETGLVNCYDSDTEWIKLKREVIAVERNSNSLDALYWAVQDKGKKLNGLVASTTPEEFISGVIEGKVNGILLKKGSQNKKVPSIG